MDNSKKEKFSIIVKIKIYQNELKKFYNNVKKLYNEKKDNIDKYSYIIIKNNINKIVSVIYLLFSG